MEWISIHDARPNYDVLVCCITRQGKVILHRYNRFGFSDGGCFLGGTKYDADIANKKQNINPDDKDNDFGVTHWFPIPKFIKE